jgi:mono/diheme cytochrome c family protein
MDFSVKQLIKLAVLGLAVPVLAAALLTWAPLPVSAEADGIADYKAKCASCHGADGKGATPVGKAMKLRDLSSPEVQSQTDDELLTVIAKGKGKMPGYESTLGADRCKVLVAFIRSFKQQP